MRTTKDKETKDNKGNDKDNRQWWIKRKQRQDEYAQAQSYCEENRITEDS